MYKQVDPNFVPCFFLRSSFSFLLIKRKKKESGKKRYTQERIQEEQRKVPSKHKSRFDIYCYFCYTLGS